MNLTNSEKLILIMLSEIYEKLGIDSQRGIDPSFVKEAIYSDNTWGFEWKYSGIFNTSDPAPPEVNDVINIMDMWMFIEEAVESFNDEQKNKLEQLASPFGRSPQFIGFDGNNESEHMSVAMFLVNQLDRFQEFKGRSFNCHHPSLDAHRRMLAVFEPLRTSLADSSLSVDQLARILNERVHPSRREA